VLEVGEGVEIVEVDRERLFDNDAVAAQFDTSRQCRLDPMRPRHDGVELVEQSDGFSGYFSTRADASRTLASSAARIVGGHSIPLLPDGAWRTRSRARGPTNG
jgi:hypothetical protein